MDEGTELAHSPISTDQSWDLNPHGLTPEPREGEAGGGSDLLSNQVPSSALISFYL